MALTKVTGQVINTSTDVTVGVLTVTNTLAVGGTVSIGGTLTYEDVTNIDSVGLITARNGIVVGSGITLSKDGDIFATGIITATTFSGSGASLTNLPSAQLTGALPAIDGSNLTGLSGVSVANQADNRLITATGTTDALNGEANLTFDGSSLSVTGAANVAGTLIFQPGGTAWSTTNTRPQLGRQADGELRLGAGSDSSSIVTFYTSASAGGTLTEKLRITSGGQLNLAGNMQFTAANPELEFNNGGPRFRVPSSNTLTIHNGGTLGSADNAAMTIDSSSRLLVGDTTSDTGLLLLNKNITAESDASDTANYHLVIKSQSNSNTSKVGIAFKNTSDTTTVGASILHHRTAGGSVGDLGFYTSPSDGTTTERLRISSDGVIHVASPDSASGGRIWANSSALYLQSGNGRQTLKVSDAASGVNRTIELTSAGNLAFPSGNGIDFSATGDGSGTDSSELFDDYEEGTWIPTLTNGFTYTTYDATYTKIGNVVNIYLYLYRDDDNTRSSEFQVTNFPYAMDTSYVSSQGLGLASSYAGNTNRKTGIINSSNTTYVSIIKSGTTQNVSYDNFVDHQRSVIMKWWYYAA